MLFCQRIRSPVDYGKNTIYVCLYVLVQYHDMYYHMQYDLFAYFHHPNAILIEPSTIVLTHSIDVVVTLSSWRDIPLLSIKFAAVYVPLVLSIGN